MILIKPDFLGAMTDAISNRYMKFLDQVSSDSEGLQITTPYHTHTRDAAASV